jgi:hypothetical protein
MAINTASFAKDLWPGVNAWYGAKYDEYPVEHLQIFDKYSSDKAFEEDVGMAGFGLAPIKNEGSSITYDDAEQSFVSRYTHITYGLGFTITREMYDDGIAAIESLKRAQALAFSIRQTMENVAANVLNRAFSNSYLGGDGLELCSELHVNQKGGTYRNELDVAADLSETALEQCLLDIADFTNDAGLKIAVRAKKIIVPSELQFEVSRIVDNPARPETANRDINAMVKAGSFPEGWVVNHYLTDADAFFIKTDCPEGLKHFERRAPEFANDSSFDTENAKFKATFRGSWGWTDPRGIFGSPGAA